MSGQAQRTDELAALLEQVQAGDETALATLVEHYAAALRRAARASLGDALRPHLDSIDLVQSIHRILLVGLRNNKFEFRDHAQFLNLALTLIRRRVARHWRKLKNDPGTATHMALGSAPIALDRTATSATDPGETLAVNEQFDRLLDHLDPLDRRLLELRMEGYTTADAARELGVEPASLRVRLGRLRQRLRDEGLLTEWM